MERSELGRKISNLIDFIEEHDLVNEVVNLVMEHEIKEEGTMICKKQFQWNRFSDIVNSHIGDYAANQYGDFPDKTIAKFTGEKIQGKLEAYVDRIGKGVRGPEEAIRDCLKIAHFACYLYAMLTKGDCQDLLVDD